MIIILLIILILSIVFYKRSVLVTASSLMLMPQWASGIEGVKLSFAIIIFQCLYFFVWIRTNKRAVCKNEYPKWITIPCLLAGGGYILSNLLGEMNNMSITLVNIICYFLYPYLIFKLITNRKELLFYVNSMLF